MLNLDWDVVVATALIELHKQYGMRTVNELQLLEYEKAIIQYLKNKGISVSTAPPYLEVLEHFTVQYRAFFEIDTSKTYTEYSLGECTTEEHLTEEFACFISPELLEAIQNREVEEALIHSCNCGTCSFYKEGICIKREENKQVPKKYVCAAYQNKQNVLPNEELPKRFYMRMSERRKRIH